MINVTEHTNRMKDKSHMIISIAAAKAFDKMKYPKKLGVAGSCLNIIENAYNKLQPTLYQMVALSFHQSGFFFSKQRQL